MDYRLRERPDRVNVFDSEHVSKAKIQFSPLEPVSFLLTRVPSHLVCPYDIEISQRPFCEVK